MSEEEACECASLGDFAIVEMRGEGLDERVFATVNRVVDHSGAKWWLYASRCGVCRQEWMIAQDERIHDNYYMRKISREEMKAIVERGSWLPDFLQFEDVIRLGPDNGKVANFFDPDDLTDTVKELIEARPTISSEEVSYLFGLTLARAARLMKRAKKMSWAQLRPYA